MKINITCNQWEGAACTQGALIFSFWVGGGAGKISHFSLCSQCVPKKFSKSSHQLPNVFCKFPICSPNTFPIAPHFDLICFDICCPLSPLLVWPVQLAHLWTCYGTEWTRHMNIVVQGIYPILEESNMKGNHILNCMINMLPKCEHIIHLIFSSQNLNFNLFEF